MRIGGGSYEWKPELMGGLALLLPLRCWTTAQNWKIPVETKELLMFLCQLDPIQSKAKYYLN